MPASVKNDGQKHLAVFQLHSLCAQVCGRDLQDHVANEEETCTDEMTGEPAAASKGCHKQQLKQTLAVAASKLLGKYEQCVGSTGSAMCIHMLVFSGRQVIPEPKPYTEFEKCRSLISCRAAYDRFAAPANKA